MQNNLRKSFQQSEKFSEIFCKYLIVKCDCFLFDEKVFQKEKMRGARNQKIEIAGGVYVGFIFFFPIFSYHKMNEF